MIRAMGLLHAPRLNSLSAGYKSLGIAALLFTIASLWGRPALAQLPQARLNAVFPTGGQKGTAVNLTLAGGTDLDEASQLYFSHPGITAAQKTQMVDGQPQPVTGEFTVTIAADVPNGIYDVRARSLYGLSNPRSFTVGDRKEINEVEPNNTLDKPMAVELNTVINGRSDGGADIDWYKFTAKAGQRILIEVKSKHIDSKMEGALELYTPAGRRIMHRRTLGIVEPLLDFTAPADGDYLLKVYDFLYTGSAEYFYRLSLHTGPHIDFVLPASGLPNTTAEYTLYGRNLPGGQPSTLKASDGKVLEQLKVQIALPADPTVYEPSEAAPPAAAGVDGITWSLASPAGASNPVTIYFASGPVAVEQEPNDAPDKAQKIAVPVELTGTFQVRGDVDLYQFDAKSGDVFWMEVFGQRSASAADPVLVVDQVKKNDKGEETLSRITAVDDTATNIGGTLFNTITDDPVFRFAAPGDGTFRITVRDRAFESRGDPSLVYRLSIRKETHDFRLVAVPSLPTTDPNQQAGQWDIGLRKGDNSQMTVMAFRHDGFNGVIDVTVEGLPGGVTCPGASIGPGQNSAMLVFSAAEQAAEWHGVIRIVGKGRLEDANLVKAVTDAEAGRRGATAQLSALDKAAVTAAEAVKVATEKAEAAKKALDGDANNEGLKKAKADADAALAKAAEESKKAADAKVAGDKKVADLAAAIAAATTARNQAARDVTRVARGGTIVWGGNPAALLTSQSRVARTITLAVLKEAAPYQLVTDAVKFSVNQGSQILIPFKLLKRSGFDNNVTITFVTPPQNLQVENKPIEKGKSEQVHRLYVQNNVAPGTYTLFVQSQAQVSYSRNPEAAALAVKDKEAKDKAATEAAEAAKKAVEGKTAADKKATDTAAEAKKTADAKVVADKLVTDTAAAAKAATDAKVVTDKAAVDTAAAAKAAVDAAAKAKEALDKDANNETLKKAKADADALVTKTADDAKKAVDTKAVADKKAVDMAEAAKKAADAKVISDKAAADADVLAKKAVEEKVAADKLMAETDQKSKAAAAAKAAADKKATDTANASKPQNLNAFFPAAAITVTVKTSPGTLALNTPGNGAIKRGTNLEVKATITRTNGFIGPVTLSLPLPPGVTGLAAPPVVIPADKNEGVLMITAAGDATMGQLTNMVVRASMEFDGPAAIDQPIAINVSQ
ncbi:MAG: hypothetical protein HY290_05590 [Planctomycetia bacterium]|nr:hypothetical protein [Planctomycetia bacterium]